MYFTIKYVLCWCVIKFFMFDLEIMEMTETQRKKVELCKNNYMRIIEKIIRNKNN